MKTILASELESLLTDGILQLEELTVRGRLNLKKIKIHSLILRRVVFENDVDLGKMEVERLYIEHCTLLGKLSGSIKYNSVKACTPWMVYFSSFPEFLAQSAVEEFFGK